MRGLPEVATDFSLLAAAVTWHALACSDSPPLPPGPAPSPPESKRAPAMGSPPPALATT